MIERELTAAETAAIYKAIDDRNIQPFFQFAEGKSGELYYKVDDKQYRLIYTPDFDWFCDIAYEGEYR